MGAKFSLKGIGELDEVKMTYIVCRVSTGSGLKSRDGRERDQHKTTRNRRTVLLALQEREERKSKDDASIHRSLRRPLQASAFMWYSSYRTIDPFECDRRKLSIFP